MKMYTVLLRSARSSGASSDYNTLYNTSGVQYDTANVMWPPPSSHHASMPRLAQGYGASNSGQPPRHHMLSSFRQMSLSARDDYGSTSQAQMAMNEHVYYNSSPKTHHNDGGAYRYFF